MRLPDGGTLTSPRIRLYFPPGRPLDLSQVRLALFATLWAQHEGGTVVASTENRAALDDLEWVGIEADEMAAPVDARRAAVVGAELIAAGSAYPCLCSAGELREMPASPTGIPEPTLYDGRCRKLTDSDRAALEKMGRKARVRILVPEDAPGAAVAASGPATSFIAVRSNGQPTTMFSAVLAARDTKSNRMIVDERTADELPFWKLIAQALGWDLPVIRFVPPWMSSNGQAVGAPGDGLTVSELRAAGFHPSTILRTAASAGWTPGDALDLTQAKLSDMVAAFDIEALSADSPVLDVASVRHANGDILRALDEDALVQAMGEHLERKGFPFTERDPAWQRRFVKVVSKSMSTLSDGELWAVLLLTPTADYDREVARVLRAPTTQALITEFEKAIDLVDNNGEDARSWRVVLADFRRNATAPGRALVTMRQVLTGQREGPGLPPILALLGVEGCRQRLEKARRYAVN